MSNLSMQAIQAKGARLAGLFGWISSGRPNHPVENVLDAMQAGLSSSLPVRQGTGLQSGWASTGEIADLAGHVGTAIIGTPLWDDPELAGIATSEGSAAALSRAYAKQGPGFINTLKGPYSLAVVDPEKGEAILATDRMGRFPLYYAVANGTLVFGTTANCVLAHPGVERDIDPQGIYNYVYFHMIPSPGTLFRGVRKLRAGEVLQFRNGDITVEKHWQPAFSEQAPGNSADLYRQLKTTLDNSVRKALPDDVPTGAFLSGGLDSSTVTGVLSEISDNRALAFAIGFQADGYDEMAYARITARHFGVDLHEYYVTPDDVVEALPLIAGSYDEPFGNSSALPAWFCARMAADQGVDRLLAGDGGDELFAGNERYAKQKLFERYGLIPDVIRGLLEPSVNAAADRLPLAGKAKSYIEQARTPLPDRLQTYNFLHRHAPGDIFAEAFLEKVDTGYPLELLRENYKLDTDASTLNRMLYLDWQITLADNDLRKVSQTCSLAGVDVSYPMLDDELVALSTRIPSAMKLKGQNLRAFYKDALRGWLPDETIAKKKQGFGLPFGVWMQSEKALQELAYDNLMSIKKHHILNPGFIDELIDLHRSGHAAYYGELIWILTVFELWTKNHPRTDD